jgi:glycosyltransferase involved in cell wall biosynthesis
MRITLVGPAYPWRGGIPLLVTELAHRLAAAGHTVVLQTWSSQGPARLLPAQDHPLRAPEAAAFPTADEPLSWRNPLHWLQRGRRIGRESDLVVLVHYASVQAPALAVLGLLAGRRARMVGICANVVPHEPRRGDRTLTAAVARVVAAVVVHTDTERAALRRITDRPVTVAALPPHLPDGAPHERPPGARHRLLFFGKVRPYKGLDVLLRAFARVDGVELDVVGEVYPGTPDPGSQAAALGLADRVRIHRGYLPAERIPELFATVDALVLPYRSATASQMVAFAFQHGVPAIVTRVGSFADDVRDGIDGFVCEPGDVGSLESAIRALYAPGRLDALRAAIAPADAEPSWTAYLAALTSEDP